MFASRSSAHPFFGTRKYMELFLGILDGDDADDDDDDEVVDGVFVNTITRQEFGMNQRGAEPLQHRRVPRTCARRPRKKPSRDH